MEGHDVSVPLLFSEVSVVRKGRSPHRRAPMCGPCLVSQYYWLPAALSAAESHTEYQCEATRMMSTMSMSPSLSRS